MTGGEVFLVGLKMRRELVDALGEQGHLHLRRARIAFMQAECLNGRIHYVRQYTPQAMTRQACYPEVLP